MNKHGQTAQSAAANSAALQGALAQVNGSDNRLLAIALDGAIGCKPWMAPDLADPGQLTTALPLNELQAAASQAAPVALVLYGDPMVMGNGHVSVHEAKTYRLPVSA